MSYQIFCWATLGGNSSGFAIGSQLGLIFLATSCNFSRVPRVPSLRPAGMRDLYLLNTTGESSMNNCWPVDDLWTPTVFCCLS